MAYEKSKDYVESIFNFMDSLYHKSIKLNDAKLMQICKLIYNYLIQCCFESKISMKDLKKDETISMKPVYEYITDNNIKLLDLNNIKLDEVDIKNPEDIERFVLTHIYYILEKN